MIFLELFYVFFCIGAFTFGGGYAMLPLMQQQVLARNWATEEELIHFIAVSESTPGPFAINMATYIGSVQGDQTFGVMGGILGSACATLGVVLPSLIIILIVAKCYDAFRKSRVVKGCMSGLKPAVVGLIANALLNVVITVFAPAANTVWELFGQMGTILSQVSTYVYLGVFAVMLFLSFKKLHPILVICLSAAIGIAAGYLGLL